MLNYLAASFMALLNVSLDFDIYVDTIISVKELPINNTRVNIDCVYLRPPA